MVTPRQIEWAAGFLEGEGSFRWTRTRSPFALVSAGQVQREPLERLQAIFGGQIYARPRHESNRQDFWQWQKAGGGAAGIMMTLYSLMSPRRKDQIRTAVAGWRTTRPRKRVNNRCGNGHEMTPENTYIFPDGTRNYCRMCVRIGNRKSDHKRRAARKLARQRIRAAE
jgi:hypothetical protein